MANTLNIKAAKIKRSSSDLVFDIFIHVFLILVFLIIAYPLYFIIIASFSDPTMVLTGKVIFWPKGITFVGFKRILEDSSIWSGYANTIFYTVIATIINILCTMAIAYPLSRKTFSGKNWIMVLLMITMYFSGGMIPSYILVGNLGLHNTRAIMIILGTVSVYNIIITRSFLKANIPAELEESASIDGCSPFRFFFQMILPLSKAIIAVLVLYYGIAHWNDYMNGLIYLSDQKKYPLQLILRSILIQSEMAIGLDTGDPRDMHEQIKIAEAIKYGVMIISSLPLLVIYPFLQKYFVQGVMIGSVKG